MIEMFVNYWLEFLLGLISSGLIALCTYLYKLYKTEKKKKQTEANQHLIEEVKEIIDENNRDIVKLIQKEEESSLNADKKAEAKMQEIQTNLTILTEGMLSIQGKQFKDECRAILESDEEIQLSIYQNLDNEHRIYNSLKGNHEGDELFRLVCMKYNAQFVK